MQKRALTAFPLVLAILSLVAMGQLLISSATASPELMWREMLATGLGLTLFFTLALSDYHNLRRFTPALFLVCVLGLVLVLVVGAAAKGAQRWLFLGPLGNFQPSEPAKLALILLNAHLLGRSNSKLGLCLVATAVTTVLVAAQPDLGTALVYIAITMACVFVAGYPTAYLLGVCALGAALAPFLLKDYQKERLLLFLDPGRDPSGAGYNLIQSQLALGSGKVWGKGAFQGEVHQLRFLPESHTDFIFAVLGEEYGLVGCLSVLILFTVLILFGLWAVEYARDEFGYFLATGVVAYFAAQVFVNVGMVVGVMPITGLPLPFLSYGGSSQLTSLIAAGLLVSVFARRRQHPKPQLPTLEYPAHRLARPE